MTWTNTLNRITEPQGNCKKCSYSRDTCCKLVHWETMKHTVQTFIYLLSHTLIYYRYNSYRLAALSFRCPEMLFSRLKKISHQFCWQNSFRHSVDMCQKDIVIKKKMKAIFLGSLKVDISFVLFFSNQLSLIYRVVFSVYLFFFCLLSFVLLFFFLFFPPVSHDPVVWSIQPIGI